METGSPFLYFVFGSETCIRGRSDSGLFTGGEPTLSAERPRIGPPRDWAAPLLRQNGISESCDGSRFINA
jgi:hypothetical protein